MKIIISFSRDRLPRGNDLAQEESASPAEIDRTGKPKKKHPPQSRKHPLPKQRKPLLRLLKRKLRQQRLQKAAATAAAKTEATTSTAAKPASAAAPVEKNERPGDGRPSGKLRSKPRLYDGPRGSFASDFVGVSSQGKFVDKSSMLAEYKKDKDTYSRRKNEKLNVKSFGPNVYSCDRPRTGKGSGQRW